MRLLIFCLGVLMTAHTALAQENSVVRGGSSLDDSVSLGVIYDRLNAVSESIHTFTTQNAACAKLGLTFDIESEICVESAVQACNKGGLVYAPNAANANPSTGCAAPIGIFFNDNPIIEFAKDNTRILNYDQCIIQGLDHGVHDGRTGFGCVLSWIGPRQWQLGAYGYETSTSCAATCFDEAGNSGDIIDIPSSNLWVKDVFCETSPCRDMGVVEACSLRDVAANGTVTFVPSSCSLMALKDPRVRDRDGVSILNARTDTSPERTLECEVKTSGLSQSSSNIESCAQTNSVRFKHECAAEQTGTVVIDLVHTVNACTGYVREACVGQQVCKANITSNGVVEVCVTEPLDPTWRIPNQETVCQTGGGSGGDPSSQAGVPCDNQVETVDNFEVSVEENACDAEGIPSYCRLEEDLPDVIVPNTCEIF